MHNNAIGHVDLLNHADWRGPALCTSELVCCKPFHPKRVAYKNSPASYLRQSLTFIIIDNFVSHHVHSLRRFWLRMQIAGAHFAYRPGR